MDQDGVAHAVTIVTLVGGLRGVLAHSYLRGSELIDNGRRELRPFRFLHSAQFILFNFPYVGGGQPREYHSYKFILFCANFNGGLHEYIERFLEAIPGSIKAIFGGDPSWRPIFPNDERLKQIILHKAINNVHFYSAYPHASRTDIDSAITLGKKLERFRREMRSRRVGSLRNRLDDLIRESAPYLTALEDYPHPDLMADISTVPLVANIESTLRRVALGRRIRDFSGWLIGRVARVPRLGFFGTAVEWVIGAVLRGWLNVGANDRNGQARSIAILAPIEDPKGADCIRAWFEEVGKNKQRPFGKVPGLHFARVAIIDARSFNALVRAAPRTSKDEEGPTANEVPGPAEPHGLASSYVLFAGVYDTPRRWRLIRTASPRSFVRDLCDQVPMMLDIWKLCYAFPPEETRLEDPDAVLDWAERCRLYGTRLYCDYPDWSVADIYYALDEQRGFVTWALGKVGRDAEDEEIEKRFDAGFARPRAARPISTGSAGANQGVQPSTGSPS